MKNLDAAIELAEKLEHVFVATADDSGQPHVAAAALLDKAVDGRVGVSAWFCPGTVTNLAVNRRIALVVWEPASDRGYQLVGAVDKVEEHAMMNGYSAEIAAGPAMPQVERKLLVRVEKVLAFSHAPHSDLE